MKMMPSSNFHWWFLLISLTSSVLGIGESSSSWRVDLTDGYEFSSDQWSDDNICYGKYKLLASTPLLLQVAARDEMCHIKIVADSFSNIFLNILHTKDAYNYTYSSFFVSQFFDEDGKPIKEKILSFPFASCSTILVGESLNFYFSFVYVEFEISMIGNDSSLASKNRCSIMKFHAAAWKNRQSFKYNKLSLGGKHTVYISTFRFEIDCPRKCTCTLGHKRWVFNCSNDKRQGLLVCNPNIASLSYLKQNIHTFKPDAFRCFPSLTKLILKDNKLQTLPTGVFDILLQLQYLNLAKNKLSSLPRQIFHKNIKLQYLILKYNQLRKLLANLLPASNSVKLIDLRNAFSSTPTEDTLHGFDNLRHLYMDGNELHSLSSARFSYSVNLQYLTLSNSSIVRLSSDIFASLTQLIRLDLSHNSLSGYRLHRTFAYQEKLIILSLSNNKLVTLTEETFRWNVMLEVLDLSYNHLTTLQAGTLSTLTQLKKLNLGFNKITELPNTLFETLRNLTVLALKNNKLSFMEDIELNNLFALNFLQLQQNSLSSVPNLVFNHTVNLTTLNLRYNYLITFNSSAFRNMYILYLNLGHNYIRSLPNDSFTAFTSLKALWLENNLLSTLPANIFDGLLHLEYIKLENNQLIGLPESLFKSTIRLRHFFIGGNNLTVYPAALLHLKKVKRLFIENCNIRIFKPFSFTSQEIIYLNITGNQLKFLPYDMFNISLYRTQLIWFYAGYNNIKQIPFGSFEDMTEMRTLYLDFNQIVRLHASTFKAMSRLEHLFLGGNNLVILPSDIFSHNTYLKRLSLSHNILVTLDSNIFETLVHLKFLEIEGNFLKEIPRGVFNSFKVLQTLLIFDNQIQYLHEHLFAETIHLTFLDMCCNKISSLPINIFTPIISLKHLILTSNGLTTLPSFTSRIYLVNLELNNNQLSQSIFEQFESLSKLKILDLSDNNIANIPPRAFARCKSLKVLSLSTNQIRRIEPFAFEHMNNLKVLDLSGNKLTVVSNASFIGLGNVSVLEMQDNEITNINTQLFQQFDNLHSLNLSQNKIKSVRLYGINASSDGITCDLRDNLLDSLQPGSFTYLNSFTFIVDEYSSCCFMDVDLTCISIKARSSYLTCRRMLPILVLRLTMWIVGLAAVIFNTGVLFNRLRIACSKRDHHDVVQNVLIGNLALSDFIMGVVMLVLSCADSYYSVYFPRFSGAWIEGGLCKAVAVL